MNRMYKHINLDYLASLSNNNPSFVNEFTSEFMKLTPLLFEQMENALTSMHINEISLIAHKVRPTCELIGANELLRLMTSIEKNSTRNFETGIINELLTKAKAELDNVIAELNLASSKPNN